MSNRYAGTRSGQVIILAAVAVGVLAVLAALTIDVGHMCAERARIQNAADAAAVATVQKLTEEKFKGTLAVPILESTARTTAATEGAAFVTLNSSAARSVITFGTYSQATKVFTPQPATTNATAVKVDVYRDTSAPGGPVELTFAALAGISRAKVQATSTAYMRQGIYGVEGDLRPFGIPKAALDQAGGTVIKYALGDWAPWDGCNDDDGDGIMDWDDLDDDNDGTKDKTDKDMNGNGIDDSLEEMWAPGQFGWLDLNGGSNSSQELLDWMQNGYPGMFAIDPVVGFIMVDGSPGLRNSLKQYFNALIGQPIVVCVYDNLAGNGAQAQYRVVAFASITLTGAKLMGENDYIEIKLNMLSNVSNCLAGYGDPLSNLRRISLVH